MGRFKSFYRGGIFFAVLQNDENAVRAPRDYLVRSRIWAFKRSCLLFAQKNVRAVGQLLVDEGLSFSFVLDWNWA